MSPEQLTSAWFSHLFDADVAGVTARPIGDGLVGMNLRVELDVVADPGQSCPTSVVVKLPSADPTSRATGVALRNYEREVKFYAELADTVDVRVPQCWFAEHDAETGDFTLVLQDMAPAVQGDQLAGCTPDVARSAVRELARLHGPRWADPSLDQIDWLSRRTPADAGQLRGLWDMFLPGFLDTYRPHMDHEQSALLGEFGPRLESWLDARDGAATVTHGDFRLDNLLVLDAASSAGGAVPADGVVVTAVDWQTPGHGPGAGDLSYFIGAGLLADDRRSLEAELVELYAVELERYEIAIDRGQLWTDYRRGSFGGVVMAVIASQVVGGSDRSEAMFAAMATRHLTQAGDLDALDLVPTAD
ncbi:MAG: phosphotransferase [Actinomycetota bacterium]